MGKSSVLDSSLVDIRFDQDGHIRLFSEQEVQECQSMTEICTSFLKSLRTFEALAEKVKDEFENVHSKLENDDRLKLGLLNQIDILYHDAEKEQSRLGEEMDQKVKSLERCRLERDRLKRELSEMDNKE
jgi:hypothetical protein